MGLVYELNINRECEDCVYGEFDLLEQKFWCNLKEDFRGPQEHDPCSDIQTALPHPPPPA